MFGSQVLELAGGLIFLYLFLSLICAFVTEWLAGFLDLRAHNLMQGISNMLGSSQLAHKVYEHPYIKTLYWQGEPSLMSKITGIKVKGKPSYIPPNIFARVIVDIWPLTWTLKLPLQMASERD